MSFVFVSYDRKSAGYVETLAKDLQSLGHAVWLDQELSGGQHWWDEILRTIRDCDIFVPVVTSRSLHSQACIREHSYAAALLKAIVPVLAEDISTNLLPPSVASLQLLDYRQRSIESALRLARALAALPPTKPLPDPLPSPPEMPCSYLGGLAQRLNDPSPLAYEEQSKLLLDLKLGLREAETLQDATSLLRQARKRRDLWVVIAEEIDELLRNSAPAAAPETPTRKVEASTEPTAPHQQPTGSSETLVRRADKGKASKAPLRTNPPVKCIEVVMPQMGESIFEGTVTKWLKHVGDQVQRDEPLFEISTDKVDAEIPAPSSGVLHQIDIAVGTTVPVNTVVGLIAVLEKPTKL